MRGAGREPAVIVIDDMNAGGTERQVIELLRSYRSSRPRPLVLAVLKGGGQRLEEARAEASSSRVFRFRKGPVSVLLPFHLSGFMKQSRAGVVCCFGLLSGLFGMMAARLAGLPVVNASIRSAPLALAGKDRISRALMMMADFRIANSHAGLTAFRMQNAPRCTVVYNGMDVDRFHDVSGVGTTYACCMVGNFRKQKDHSTALRAFSLVRRSLPGSRFALVGRDRGTLGSMEALAAELGLEGAVDFYTDCSDPSGVVSASRIGLLLSPDGEGISNSILEYMALGRPVVATDCPGNRETLLDGAAGLLVPNRPEDVADRIQALLVNPGEASRMGTAGRERVRSVFSTDAMVHSFEAVFLKATGMSPHNDG
jgi:glycosyltransferase involved in cell wall biosynthesis